MIISHKDDAYGEYIKEIHLDLIQEDGDLEELCDKSDGPELIIDHSDAIAIIVNEIQEWSFESFEDFGRVSLRIGKVELILGALLEIRSHQFFKVGRADAEEEGMDGNALVMRRALLA